MHFLCLHSQCYFDVKMSMARVAGPKLCKGGGSNQSTEGEHSHYRIPTQKTLDSTVWKCIIRLSTGTAIYLSTQVAAMSFPIPVDLSGKLIMHYVAEANYLSCCRVVSDLSLSIYCFLVLKSIPLWAKNVTLYWGYQSPCCIVSGDRFCSTTLHPCSHTVPQAQLSCSTTYFLMEDSCIFLLSVFDAQPGHKD